MAHLEAGQGCAVHSVMTLRPPSQPPGQWALARLFVDKGVDVTARCASLGRQGLTPLHCACLGRRRVPSVLSSPSSVGDDEDEDEAAPGGGRDGPGGAEQMLGQVDVVKVRVGPPGNASVV